MIWAVMGAIKDTALALVPRPCKEYLYSVKPVNVMRYSDRPIFNPRDDRLGRHGFAKVLAQSIHNLKVADDGFVIGIAGPWGSGKSSVIELLVNSLLNLEILDLLTLSSTSEPVSLRDVEEMALLYSEVEHHVALSRNAKLNAELWERNHRTLTFQRLHPDNEKARKAERYFALLQSVRANPQNVVVRFSPWLIPSHAELTSSMLSEIARGIGHQFGSEVAEAFASFFARLAEVSSVLGTAVNLSTGSPFGTLAADGIVSARNVLNNINRGPTLEDARSSLQASLRRLKGSKAVVIIDDLDRLSPREAVDIVSTVKSLGNLPNVIYIMSYDSDKLSGLIHKELNIAGREYLQKIVQYEVSLPPCNRSDLLSLLNSDLGEIIGTLDREPLDRLTSFWEFSLKQQIQTPRDVKRLMNAYSVAAAALAEFTDPVDLLILESLRLFEPDIYSWIVTNLDEIVT